MALNCDHKTQKITITKKTVKITNGNDAEFPKAQKKEGKFHLPWETEHQPPGTFTNFKYFFQLDDSGVPNETKLNEEPLMQMMAVDKNRIENPPHNGIRVTWLGHASALFQLDNVNFLVNPNFNERGIKYYHPGDDKRYRKPVYTVDELPRVDCVFITNTHFDYLDLSSVRLLNDRFGDMILWYVPMGVQAWMSKAGCGNVVELDWWKEDEVDFVDHTILNDEGEEEETNTTTFNIACTPSQSYHSRDLADDNACLWCSWVVISPRYKIFLAGATGYQDQIFKSIGRRYGPFHMCALPIGGYEPAWKFAYGNVTPEQSVMMHKDLLAMCSVALSWGTFSHSNEYYLEPPQRLKDELQKEHLSEMQFFLLRHGESRLVEIKEADDNDNDQSAENAHVKMNGHVETNGHTVGVALGGDGDIDGTVVLGGITVGAIDVVDADAHGDVDIHVGGTTITSSEGETVHIGGDVVVDDHTVITTSHTAVDDDDANVDLDALLNDMHISGGQTITTTTVEGIDVDGDGDIDIHLGGQTTTTTTTVITEGGDVDGDGDIDIHVDGGSATTVITTTQVVDGDAGIDGDVTTTVVTTTESDADVDLHVDGGVDVDADADAGGQVSVGGGASLDINVSFGFN